MSMSAMPDISLDSVETLASFAIPPQGRYLCLLSLAPKDINGKGNLVFAYTVQETIELASPTDVEPKPGAKFDELFSFDRGLPMAKDKLVKLAEALGLPSGVSLADLVEQVQQVGVEVTLKHRADKNDPEKKYANVAANTFKVA